MLTCRLLSYAGGVYCGDLISSNVKYPHHWRKHQKTMKSSNCWKCYNLGIVQSGALPDKTHMITTTIHFNNSTGIIQLEDWLFKFWGFSKCCHSPNSACVGSRDGPQTCSQDNLTCWYASLQLNPNSKVIQWRISVRCLQGGTNCNHFCKESPRAEMAAWSQ